MQRDWLIDQVNAFGKVEENGLYILVLRETFLNLTKEELFCVQHLMKYGYNIKIGGK